MPDNIQGRTDHRKSTLLIVRDGEALRITNQIILGRSLSSIQDGLSRTAALERQIVTGQRFDATSQDPISGRAVMTLDGDLRASEQYSRSIESARNRLAVADDTLQTMTGLLGRAREIAIQQGTATASTETRAAAELEVLELKEAMLTLGNERLNGAYVFGGAHADLVPLDSTGALNPGSPARGAPSYEIASGMYALGAHDAGEMFIDSDAIGSLDALSAALSADDPAAIQTAGTRVDTSIGSLQELVGDIGARQIRLDVAQDSHSIIDGGRLAQRSALIDTSLEEAITQLASLQASYQATLLTTSRILDTSLVNFLR